MATIEDARRAVYDAGVIIELEEDAPLPSLERLAEACDLLGVRRPIALQEALAAEQAGG